MAGCKMKKKLITQNDDLIALGVSKMLIRISKDGKRVEYLNHGILRDWTKPEAIVEARSYLALVLQYGYPDDRIRLFAPVTVGSSLREAKESLQREIAEKWGLADELTKIDKRRKSALEKLDKRPEFAALEKKARKENAGYKTAADEIAAEAEKATAELRDKLESEYRQRSKDIFPDEDIFMAIAEDIGFDATGKPTKVNELDEIGTALAKFIKTAAEERT